jgi:YjjI family glycine radical enzyme
LALFVEFSVVHTDAMEMTELRTAARSLIADRTLTYHQRVARLAVLAEESLEQPAVSEACAAALDKRIICDMFEGHAPYRARYLLPDYQSAIRRGSAFLELPAPTDLNEALWFLISMYTQVPSITGYPVYLGDLDKVLAPFIEGMGVDELVASLRPFWRALDRVLPDAFVHTNLGPDDSAFARAVLRLERELLQVVPNITLKVQPGVTPNDLLLDAVETVFECGKPHFVNHEMMVSDLGEQYAAVSCYNSLPIGGGSHTLVRLNLAELVHQHTGDVENFFDDTLPRYVELTSELIESRIRHLVEQANFYDHLWLVDEGLISLDRFSAMFGIFGLAEAVNQLMEMQGVSGTYGHDPAANQLSYRITAEIAALVAGRPLPYCEGNGGHAFLHSQSGIDSDVGVTAGTRIPVGSEPDLYEHIRTVAPHHYLFDAGISDIVHFDDTARRNPQAVVDIIRGAFREGMRDFTFNLDSNGFIRITGYLVRKSDLQAIGQGNRHSSAFLGAGAEAQSHVTRRAPKRVVSNERRAGCAQS